MEQSVTITIDAVTLEGTLGVPELAKGLVVLARVRWPAGNFF